MHFFEFMLGNFGNWKTHISNFDLLQEGVLERNRAHVSVTSSSCLGPRSVFGPPTIITHLA